MTTTTTTPADVLAILQAHWRATQPPTQPSEAEAEPATIRYCGPHNEPTGWEYSPDNYDRPGWRTASCKRCGRFVGYQQPPKARKAK